jgi:hypothetical protein
MIFGTDIFPQRSRRISKRRNPASTVSTLRLTNKEDQVGSAENSMLGCGQIEDRPRIAAHHQLTNCDLAN